MSKFEKRWAGFSLTALLLIVTLITSVGITPVVAVPEWPCNYYGYVYINGTITTSGHNVVAKINGTQYGTTATTDSSGRYSYTMPAQSSDPPVSGGVEGDTITFFVDSIQATPTGTFTRGAIRRLDLNIYTGTLAVTCGSVTNITSTSATLTGNVTDMGSNGSVLLTFEYGQTTSYGTTVTATPPTLATPGACSANLAGLTQSTTYYYKFVATGTTTAICTGSFQTTTPVLTVTTGSAVNVGCNSATLIGNLTDTGGNSTVNLSFEWGPTTSYGTTVSAGSRNSIGAFSLPLSGLSQNSIYYFKAKAAAGSATAEGLQGQFTTSSCGGGGGSTSVHWFWGAAYSNSIPVSSGTIKAFVDGNQAATTTTNTSGGYSIYVPGTSGANVTFYVNDVLAAESANWRMMGMNNLNLHSSPPTLTVTTDPATSVTASSATLNGRITNWNPADTSATVWFMWGTTSGGPYTTVAATPASLTNTGSFTYNLTGLNTTTTTYYAKARAMGTTSGEKLGSEISFGGGAALTVVTDPATSVTASSATLNGRITNWNPADTSATVWFMWGTTSGGPYTTVAATPASLTNTGSFTYNLTGLNTTTTTYYAKARAMGTTSGEKLGSEISFGGGAALTVVTDPATSVTASSATLNGRITNWNPADTSATVWFMWGTTSGGPYTTVAATPASLTNTGSFTYNLTGLNTTTTTYYAKARAMGTTSGEKLGSEISFGSPPPICGTDPLGCTSGTSVVTGAKYTLWFSRYQATATTSVTKVNLKATAAGGGTAKVAIYADSGTAPGALLNAVEAPVSLNADAVTPITITSTQINSGTWYWLAYQTSTQCIGLPSDYVTGNFVYIYRSSPGGFIAFPATILLSDISDGYPGRATISASN